MLYSTSLSSVDLAHLLAEPLDELLVGIENGALGHANRHQQEVQAAELLQRLAIGLDRRLGLGQQIQDVGVEPELSELSPRPPATSSPVTMKTPR